jgi:O-antigen/teichoic acid export membrane protein
VIVTSWPLYLAMAVFAPCILRVFGPEYSSGATALTILSLAMLVNLATGTVGTVLLMGGKSRWVLADKIAVVTLNVVGNLLLIPHFGIVGAAVSWAVTIVLDSSLAFAQVRYGMRLGGPLRIIGLCAAMSLACFGVIPFAWRLVAGTSLPDMVGALALATLAYVPLVWRRREQVGLSMLAGSVLPQRRAAGAAGLRSR